MRLLESSSCVFPVEDLLVVIIINIAQKLIPQIIHRSLYDLLLAIEIPVIGSPCNVCLTYDIRNRDFRESFLPKQRKKPLGYPLLHPFHILCGSLHQATGLSAVREGTRGSWNTARLHRQRIFAQAKRRRRYATCFRAMQAGKWWLPRIFKHLEQCMPVSAIMVYGNRLWRWKANDGWGCDDGNAER